MIAALPMMTSCARPIAGIGSRSPAPGSARYDGATRPTAVDGRPRYHISAPPGGWINDPQRPLKVNDSWTLWALYNPTYPAGGTSWRRWTSKDLVTWHDQGIAIARNTTPFGDVWSGSTVIDSEDTAGFGAGTLITLVTMPTPGFGQSCALWYSRDGGASFAFHAIVLPNPGGHQDFRDPTVFWHPPTRRWVMTLSEKGKIGIYTSPNLKQWAYASGFLSDVVGPIMECSHLFKLHLYDTDGRTSIDKWILLVGGNGTKRGFTVGTYYWVGDFDGITFTPGSPEGQWLDGGADFYAAVVWTDPAAADPLTTAYSIAWMSNWDYVKTMPVTHDYRGQLSIVRQLRLQWDRDVPRLFSTPLPAQDAVFDTAIAGPDQTIGDGLDYRWPAGAGASSCRIDFALTRVGATWPAAVRLSVRISGAFFTQITFAMQDNKVGLKRDASGPNPPDVAAWRQDRSALCDFSAGKATASLFIDSSSVELFVNDGAITMSELISSPLGAIGLLLSSTGGDVIVSDMVVRNII
jgi:levanbiose-producing levanase